MLEHAGTGAASAGVPGNPRRYGCSIPFVGYMAVGAIWFAILKKRSPDTLVSIQHDLEG